MIISKSKPPKSDIPNLKSDTNPKLIRSIVTTFLDLYIFDMNRKTKLIIPSCKIQTYETQ